MLYCARCGKPLTSAGCVNCLLAAKVIGTSCGPKNTTEAPPLRGLVAETWLKLVADSRVGVLRDKGLVGGDDLLRRVCESVLWLERVRQEGGW